MFNWRVSSIQIIVIYICYTQATDACPGVFREQIPPSGCKDFLKPGVVFPVVVLVSRSEPGTFCVAFF